MPRLKASDQIEALRRQRDDIAARLREAEEAEKAKAQKLKKRRHEVAGEAILTLIEKEPEGELSRAFAFQLKQLVRKADDRALFADLLADVKKSTQPTDVSH